MKIFAKKLPMFDLEECLEKLQKALPPQDLEESSILLPEKIGFRLLSEKYKNVFGTSEVLYKNAKSSVKKTFRTPLNCDSRQTGPGYFDDAGNYILHKQKEIKVNWTLKRNNALEGPFSDKEFKEVISNISPEGVCVKRDLDKGFVSLKKLLEEVPRLGFKDLNRFFSENQIVDSSGNEDEFFDKYSVNNKNSRLENFLRNHEISASVDFIINSIKGMKKIEAIETLKDITGLDRYINTNLVDLIVESMDFQILSDVDKDGFYIGTGDKNVKRK